MDQPEIWRRSSQYIPHQLSSLALQATANTLLTAWHASRRSTRTKVFLLLFLQKKQILNA
jgi:hypothetical protein